MDDKLSELTTKLQATKRLMDNPDFRLILLPHFEERARFHAMQCRNRDLPAEKRAEHIEAAALAEDLVNYLENRKKTQESMIREHTGKKK